MSYMSSSKKRVSLTGKRRSQVELIALDGVMASLGVLLMFITRLQLLPGVAPWLIYEMGDVPAIITALIAGPVHGLFVLAVVCVVQLVTPFSSGLYGLLMHFISSGVLVLIPALLWRYKSKNTSLIVGLILGTLAMTGVMIPLNIYITPKFAGMPVEAVKQMILPAIVPFNLIKGAMNSAASFVVFLALSKIFKKFR